MIDPALLARLQKADPKTYGRWMPIATISLVDVRLADAWLQHVLQDAIRAKGWQGIVLFSDSNSRAVIDGPDTGFGHRKKLSECIGDLPAEALLLAYLAAVEAHEMQKV